MSWLAAHCSGICSRVRTSIAARKASAACSEQFVVVSRRGERIQRIAQIVLDHRPLHRLDPARVLLQRQPVGGFGLDEPVDTCLALDELNSVMPILFCVAAQSSGTFCAVALFQRGAESGDGLLQLLRVAFALAELQQHVADIVLRGGPEEVVLLAFEDFTSFLI